MRILLLATAALLLAPTLAAHAGTTSYFLSRDGEMSTTPYPRFLTTPSDVYVERFDSPQLFSARTAPLAAPLRIALTGDAFSLHLEDREKLAPGSEYRTQVGILLAEADGDLVRNPDGSPYYLAHATVSSPEGSLQQFRVVTFAANTTGPLATVDGALVVPAGLRIQLEFRLVTDGGTIGSGDTYAAVVNAAYDAATGAVPATGNEQADLLWTRLRDETLDSATQSIRNNPTIWHALYGGYVPASTFELHGDHPDASRLDIQLG